MALFFILSSAIREPRNTAIGERIARPGFARARWMPDDRLRSVGEKCRLCHADFMNRTPLRGLIVLLIVTVAGYGLYRSQNAGSSLVAQPLRPPIASPVESHQLPANPSKAATLPTTATPVTKTLLQLHAAFRESQRCIEERVMVRAKSYNPDGATSPHMPGCDDMKGAQRQRYEATHAGLEGQLETVRQRDAEK
jgi:hypothetical protein